MGNTVQDVKYLVTIDSDTKLLKKYSYADFAPAHHLHNNRYLQIGEVAKVAASLYVSTYQQQHERARFMIAPKLVGFYPQDDKVAIAKFVIFWQSNEYRTARLSMYHNGTQLHITEYNPADPSTVASSSTTTTSIDIERAENAPLSSVVWLSSYATDTYDIPHQVDSYSLEVLQYKLDSEGTPIEEISQPLCQWLL
jgi:hypothetical protein